MDGKTASIGRRIARGVRRRARSAWAQLAGRGPLIKPAEFDAEMRRLVGPAPWCVDSVSIVDNRLVLAGWAIAVDGNPQGIDIRIDGVRADDLQRGLHRPDVAFYYWFLPAADRSGFQCAHRLQEAPATHWAIENVDRHTGRAIEPWHNFYVRANDLIEGLPVPSMLQIRRVHGGNSQNQFLIEGYSTYVKFDLALRAVTGRCFADFQMILDFGCGCGRLARYFPSGRRLVGTDIDRENVEWCRANLSGEFLVNVRTPPLDLASGQVDCVVANDVFPHLPELDGSAWLAEIARVCRAGAIVLISIASERALTRARLTADRYAEIRTLDFIDLSHNTDLDSVLEDRTSYRNIFHSHAYVRAQWPEAGFEMLAVIPGLSANQQDLVVMRKR